MMARILVLDLNPKLNYPDLSIAYLVTPLRAAGFQVEVQRLATNHIAKVLIHPNDQATASDAELSLVNIQNYLEHTQPELILIPNYLNHYTAIHFLAQCTQKLQLPLILGGTCFNTYSHELSLWLNIQGVTAIFVGDADWVIAELVETALSKQDLSLWPGIYQQGIELDNITALPLQELQLLPIPDLSDFAWQKYRSALIPVLTGRTTSLNQQQFYSPRPVQAVLDELQIQAQLYQRKGFIFLDSSLNTNLAMWHGLIDRIQHIVPNCQWMATIYLDGQNNLGLDFNTLVAARAAGLRHLNINLETSKLLKMEANRELVADAYQAGLSVRCLVNNASSFNHLADLPNTKDGVLRKWIETPSIPPMISQTASTIHHHQLKPNPEAELKTPKIPTTAPLASKSLSTPPVKSFWQRCKPAFLINKTHKPTQVDSLV